MEYHKDLKEVFRFPTISFSWILLALKTPVKKEGFVSCIKEHAKKLHYTVLKPKKWKQVKMNLLSITLDISFEQERCNLIDFQKVMLSSQDNKKSETC